LELNLLGMQVVSKILIAASVRKNNFL